MAEAEVKEIELGVAPDMASYNAARDKGETVIAVPAEKPAEQEPEEIQSEEENAGEPDQPEEVKLPKVKGAAAQKKIDRLTKQNAELEEKLKQYQGKEAKTPEPSPAPVSDSTEFPLDKWITKDGRFKTLSQDQWNAIPGNESKTTEEFLDDRDDARDSYNQLLAREREVVARREKLQADLKVKVQEVQAKYPDWDKVMGSIKDDDIKLPPKVYEFIAKLKNAPDVGYFLAKNDEARKQMAEFSKAEDEAEMIALAVRVSDSLESSNKTEDDEESIERDKAGKFVSKSAPPIRPVNSGNTRSTVPMDRMGMKDYNAAREAGRQR